MASSIPKPAATRQRRNRASTKTTLHPVEVKPSSVPKLPASRKWLPATLRRWKAVMSSPMAPEFDPSDMEGLYMLAELWDDFNRLANMETNSRTVNLRLRVSAEIRQQEQRFGLSPIDRRRLQWEIDRGEEAQKKTQVRRNQKAVAKVEDAPDPRAMLA